MEHSKDEKVFYIGENVLIFDKSKEAGKSIRAHIIKINYNKGVAEVVTSKGDMLTDISLDDITHDPMPEIFRSDMKENTKNKKLRANPIVSDEVFLFYGYEGRKIKGTVVRVDLDRNIADVDVEGKLFLNIPFDFMQLTFMGDNPNENQGGEVYVKNDVMDDKLRWDLLPLAEIEDIVRVYHAGAKKYGPNRWQGLDDGMARYKAAMLRHLMEYEKGNDVDEDTGCLHLAMMAWNAIAMLHISKKETVYG